MLERNITYMIAGLSFSAYIFTMISTDQKLLEKKREIAILKKRNQELEEMDATRRQTIIEITDVTTSLLVSASVVSALAIIGPAVLQMK